MATVPIPTSQRTVKHASSPPSVCASVSQPSSCQGDIDDSLVRQRRRGQCSRADASALGGGARPYHTGDGPSGLVTGDRLLFLREDGATTAVAVFPDDADAPHPFLPALATQAARLSGCSGRRGAAGGCVWSLGWLVGCVACPTARPSCSEHSSIEDSPATRDVAVISPEPLDSVLLHRLRVALGLVAAQTDREAEEEEEKGTPAARSLFPLPLTEYERNDIHDGPLLSPKRDDSDERSAASSTAQRHLEGSPITLELLVRPAAAAAAKKKPREGRQAWQEPLPPMTLLACSEQFVQPYPHTAEEEDDEDETRLLELESSACRSSAAAAAAFWYRMQQQRLTSCGASSFACVARSESSATAFGSGGVSSTWAYFPNSPAPAQGHSGAIAWTRFLQDVAKGVAERATLVYMPEPLEEGSSPREHLPPLAHLRSASGAGSTSGAAAALELWEMLAPLPLLGFTCNVAVSPTQEEIIEWGSFSPLLQVLSASEERKVLSHLSGLARRARTELDVENKRIGGGGGAMGPRPLWKLSEVVERVLLAAGSAAATGAATAPRAERISHMLKCLSRLALPQITIGPFANAMLGLSCLAAASVEATGQQQRWFASEAEELLGCQLVGHDPHVIIIPFLRFLLRRIASFGAGKENDHPAGKYPFHLRLVQLPITCGNGDGEPEVPASFYSDALHDVVEHRVLRRGLYRRVREEALAEGVWDGVARQDFETLGVSEDAEVGVPALEILAGVLAETVREAAEECGSTSSSSGADYMLSLKRKLCCALVLSGGASSRDAFLTDGSTVQAQRVDGATCVYLLDDLLAPVQRFCLLQEYLSTQRSSPNAISREWMRAELSVTTPDVGEAALSLLSSTLTNDECCTVVEVDSGHAFSGNLGRLLSLFDASSQGYAHVMPIRSFCQEMLSLAVRGYCCCCRRHRGGGPPSTTFSFPSSSRKRSFYVGFLQLTAAAKYREACQLCVREVPSARGLVVGASNVIFRRADWNALARLRRRVTVLATHLLQRVGRGFLGRGNTCGRLRVEKQQAAWLAQFEARLQVNRSAYEAQDRQDRMLVEQTTRRAAAALSAAQSTLTAVAGGCGSAWKDSAAMVEAELARAVQEVKAFEEDKARAERDAHEAIRSTRQLLTTEWYRQTAKASSTAAKEDDYDTIVWPLPRCRSTVAAAPRCVPVPPRQGSEGRGHEEPPKRSLALGDADIRRYEAKCRRAALVVAEALRQQRQAETEARNASITMRHLQRQQRRFDFCAVRREERTGLEREVLALGSREGEPAVAVPPVPVADTAAGASYATDQQGLLQTRSDKTAEEALLRRDHAAFAAQRSQLSLWEESTLDY